MTQLRKHYRLNRWRLSRLRFRAAQRAAKERKRVERVTREEPAPDASYVRLPRSRPSGFRVVIICLDDGERIQFTSFRMPWGLSVSATAAGEKVASVIKNYTPLKFVR